MTETHEQRVERLARAAYEGATYWCVENDHGETDPYEGQIVDFCRAIARAIIASDREAGLVTVPREPTEAMVQAHIAECAGDADEADEARVRDCWAAMIEAALDAHEPK